MDLNIDNYNIEDILSILELDECTMENISEKIQYYIDKFIHQSELKNFFIQCKEKLENFYSEIEGFEPIDNSKSQYDLKYESESPAQQVNNWYINEALKQNNVVQNEKITERKQKIDVFQGENHHFPMNREQLGVNNNYNLPVAQDVLNPTLENTIKRQVVIDSQFRQSSATYNSLASEFTFDLSQPLKKVLNLMLYSFSIPYSWYLIDKQYNNNFFIVVNKNQNFKIEIGNGNYDATSFCLVLNNSFSDGGFINPNPTDIVIFNTQQGKVTINLNNVVDPSGNVIHGIDKSSNFDINQDNPYLEFFIEGNVTNYECLYSQQSANKFDSTLGWVMGFRLPKEPILLNGNTPIACLDLNGPKYFIIALDDYNSNRIDNALVSITELSSRLEFPTYYKPALFARNCVQGINNLNRVETEFIQQNNNNGLLFAEKVNITQEIIPQVVPTSPRTLTNAQIFTINEISNNRGKINNLRSKPPNQSDTFAIIPLKTSSLSTGSVYCDYGGTLQENKRTYFGPVDISRMKITLKTDKGYLVNLNGLDWTITLLCEELYQF